MCVLFFCFLTYSYILGKENYRAIAANEGKNKADMSKAERLGKVPELIRGMYSRTEITTPPIDKDYDISSGKKLNVVIPTFFYSFVTHL